MMMMISNSSSQINKHLRQTKSATEAGETRTSLHPTTVLQDTGHSTVFGHLVPLHATAIANHRRGGGSPHGRRRSCTANGSLHNGTKRHGTFTPATKQHTNT